MSAANPSLPMVSIPRWKSLTRWQAFAVHFALSALIFSSLVALMYFFWFPGELFMLDGGWQGLKLVALIDLVLGPALTLILWNPEKKSLVFDMCVVAAIQIGALVYGFATTYDQRTVAVVYADDRFVSVSNADLTKANKVLVEKEVSPIPLSKISNETPALLMAPIPNKDTFGQYLEDVLNGFPQASERSDQYIGLNDGHQDLQEWTLDQQGLENLGWGEAQEKEAASKGFDLETLEIYPFEMRYADGVVLFDPTQMKIVDYVPLEKPEAQDSPSTQTAESNLDE